MLDEVAVLVFFKSDLHFFLGVRFIIRQMLCRYVSMIPTSIRDTGNLHKHPYWKQDREAQ